ncbi:hypothetical protein [Nocardia yunnanensis]|nr:hypothetical protein [Nocardia yunnanensis]
MHVAVERALAAATFATTILRPGGFDSNALGWAEDVRAGRPIELPYPDAELSMIHPLDIADIAIAALTGDELRGRTVSLTGPTPISFRAQIAALSAALGQEIQVATITPEAAREQMARTMPSIIADALLAVWADVAEQPQLPAETTETLLGVPARTFDQWAHEHAAAFTAG